jgi:hypothetical protein
LHLFGKIKLHGVEDGYIHVRLSVTEKEVKFHGLDKYEDLQGKKFNAIFHETDPLEWFTN